MVSEWNDKDVYSQYIELGTHIDLMSGGYGDYPTSEALLGSERGTRRFSRDFAAGEGEEKKQMERSSEREKQLRVRNDRIRSTRSPSK